MVEGERGKGKVLVVDDEPAQRSGLASAVRMFGYDVAEADSPKSALELIRFRTYDVLVTDMSMPEMNGLDLVARAKENDPGISCIVVTGQGTIETAVEAMKRGAEDYVLKPVEFSSLELILQRVFRSRESAAELKRLKSENQALKREIEIRYQLVNAIGKSPQMAKVLEQIKRNAATKVPLLILGEPGTGKRDIARMVHYNSPWAANDILFFDAANVPEEFHEGQLFGEEALESTGVFGRPGLFEKAHLGTLVFTAIDRVSKACQARISRALAEEKTSRGSGRKFYPAHARLIAIASEAAFEKAIRENELRWDFYQRLQENMILLAPLRERREDIPYLTAGYVKGAAQAWGKSISSISPEVIQKLSSYDFPGNNRELQALVESAVIRCTENTLRLEHFLFGK